MAVGIGLLIWGRKKYSEPLQVKLAFGANALKAEKAGAVLEPEYLIASAPHSEFAAKTAALAKKDWFRKEESGAETEKPAEHDSQPEQDA